MTSTALFGRLRVTARSFRDRRLDGSVPTSPGPSSLGWTWALNRTPVCTGPTVAHQSADRRQATWVASIQSREQWLRTNQMTSVGKLPPQLWNEAELKYVPLRP